MQLSMTMSRLFLNISKEGDSTTSLGNLCQCSITLTVKKVFPDVQREPPLLQFLPIAHVFLLGTTEKSLTPFSLHPPFKYVHTFMGSPLSLLFPRLNSPSSPFSSRRDTPVLYSSLWHFAWLSAVSPCLSCTGELRTGCTGPDVASQY